MLFIHVGKLERTSVFVLVVRIKWPLLNQPVGNVHDWGSSPFSEVDGEVRKSVGKVFQISRNLFIQRYGLVRRSTHALFPMPSSF